jgi:hypothetical protein
MKVLVLPLSINAIAFLPPIETKTEKVAGGDIPLAAWAEIISNYGC